MCVCVCVCVCVWHFLVILTYILALSSFLRMNRDNLDLRLYIIVIKVISSYMYVVRKIVNIFNYQFFRICFAVSKGTITSRRFF